MMKNKLRPFNVMVIGLGALALGALVVWGVSCTQQAQSVPPQSSTIARQLATPGQSPTRVPPAVTTTIDTSGAMVTPRASAPANTPLPTPTPTKEEKLLVEMQHGNIQSATSPDECAKILETQPWCNVTKSVVRIVRPEWEQLLPRTEFYLGKYDLYGGEVTQQRNALIIEQDGQRYTVETFDRLLEINGIATITDENRELVAKAFALMTIPGYLKEEVVFTEWQKLDVNAQRSSEPYNYCLRSWAKLGGLELAWCYVFQKERVDIASGPIVSKSRVGDYIEILPEQAPFLYYKDYRFPGGTP